MKIILSHLKLLLVFFLNLITNNPVKTIVLIVTIVTYIFAGSFDDIKSKSLIVHQFKEGSVNVYISKKESNNEIEYKTLTSEKEIEIDQDGYYHYYKYNDVNVLFWTLFGVSALWTIIGIFIDDDNWDFDDNWKNSLLTLVSLELDGDTYYYMALGRLVGKSDRSLTYNVLREFNIRYLRDIYLCPKFETRVNKRNNILSKIGIN